MMLESLFKKVMQPRRHAAKKAREMVQQNRNGWRWITGKLSDCSEQDPAKCEVYLVEEIRQAEQQNKVVTVRFKQFCLYVVKF
jgi:hypothetical protein